MLSVLYAQLKNMQQKKESNLRVKTALLHFNLLVKQGRLCGLKISTHPTKIYGLCELTRRIGPVLPSLVEISKDFSYFFVNMVNLIR